MSHFRIEHIINTILPVCKEKKWSEESMKKLRDIAIEKNVPKLIVEFAVVSEIIKVFCETTYALEGDDPLGLSCWLVFDRLDNYINNGITLSQETIKAYDRAGELISEYASKIRIKLNDSIYDVKIRLSNIIRNIDNLKSLLARLNEVNNS